MLREYRTGTFFRQFTLSETINQAKIDAKLTDGVLRLELPKVEKARPRQITVRGRLSGAPATGRGLLVTQAR